MRAAARIALPLFFAVGALFAFFALGGGACAKPANITTKFSADKERVKLVFAGDLSVARDVARVIDEKGKGDPAYPFSFVRPLVKDADLFFANLECVLTDSDAEEATAKTFRIRAPKKYARKLREVGIDVVSVANNHAMDFGAAGFKSTLAELAKLGIINVGVRTDGAKHQDAVIVEVGQAKVGFLAYNQHGDEYKHPTFPREAFKYDIAAIEKDVAKARAKVDFLVVSVHGGPELSHLPVDWQIEHSRRVIDAGADVWLGHHAHVVEPIEEYKGKLIVYSLGDFVFDKKSPWLRERTGPRFFLEVELQGKQRAGWRVLAGNHDVDYRPRLTPAFALDPWINPKTIAGRFSDQLKGAKVERLHTAKPTDVCTWQKSRISIPGGYVRWLMPRHSCIADAKAEKRSAWLTVARTAELSDEVMRQGIWAVPHADGPLRMTFPQVELDAALEGFAGLPDYAFFLGKKKPPEPVLLTVRIKDAASPIEHAEAFPFAKGWRDFTIDTSALAGQKRDVVVEVTGGAGAAEGRFMFDLY